MQHLHVLMFPGQGLEFLRRFVGGTVIDEHDLVMLAPWSAPTASR